MAIKKKKSVICRDVDGPKECQSEVVRKKKKNLILTHIIGISHNS